jgi:hypothetical protein
MSVAGCSAAFVLPYDRPGRESFTILDWRDNEPMPTTEDLRSYPRSYDSDSRVKVGMSKRMVARSNREPLQKRHEVRDTNVFIMDPNPWTEELKDGDRLETWLYSRRGGTLFVYFLNGSDIVWHTTFEGNTPLASRRTRQ